MVNGYIPSDYFLCCVPNTASASFREGGIIGGCLSKWRGGHVCSELPCQHLLWGGTLIRAKPPSLLLPVEIARITGAFSTPMRLMAVAHESERSYSVPELSGSGQRRSGKSPAAIWRSSQSLTQCGVPETHSVTSCLWPMRCSSPPVPIQKSRSWEWKTLEVKWQSFKWACRPGSKRWHANASGNRIASKSQVANPEHHAGTAHCQLPDGTSTSLSSPFLVAAMEPTGVTQAQWKQLWQARHCWSYLRPSWFIPRYSGRKKWFRETNSTWQPWLWQTCWFMILTHSTC